MVCGQWWQNMEFRVHGLTCIYSIEENRLNKNSV